MNDLNNLGVQGPGAVRAVRQARDHAGGRPHAPAAGRLHAGRRRRRADAAPGQPAVCRRSPPTSDYTPPSFNAFDRVTDVDTPLRSYQDLGGASLNVDWKLGTGPADVDHRVALLELEPVERSRLHRPAGHHDLGGAVEAAAVDAGSALRRRRLAARSTSSSARSRFHQTIDSDPVVQAGTGLAPRRASCWRRAPPRRRPACSTATATTSTSTTTTPARRSSASSQWSVTDRLRLLPGLRFNYDQKDVDFDQQVYGGLQTTDPALIALQRSILAPQAYTARRRATPTRPGQITAAYKRRRAASTPMRPTRPASSRSAST